MLPAIRSGTHGRLPVTNRRKVGSKSSHHAPYVLGYTRATLADTKGCKLERGSESQKVGRGSDWRLTRASKIERAACRERVDIGVVSVIVKKKCKVVVYRIR